MAGRAHWGRRPLRVGSGSRAAGLVVALVVLAAGTLAGCSGTHSVPTPKAQVEPWDSLTWSGPVATEFSSSTQIVSWKGGLVAATPVARGASIETQIRASADGIAWSDVATDEPSFRDASPEQLIAGGRGLLLLGYRNLDGSGGTPTAWTSEDGRAWKASDIPTLGLTVAGPGGFVSTTHDGLPNWRSSDGVQWEALSPDPDASAWVESVNWVAATASGYVAGGYIERAQTTDQFPEVAAWFSTDGRRWQRAAVDETPGSSATYAPGSAPVGLIDAGYIGRDGSIAVGYCCATVVDFRVEDAQTSAWTSADGSTWRLGDLPTEVGPDWRLAADGGRIVAINERTGQIHESFDGKTWREVTASGAAPSGLSGIARLVLMPTGLMVFDPGTDGLPARIWMATAKQLSSGSGAPTPRR